MANDPETYGDIQQRVSALEAWKASFQRTWNRIRDVDEDTTIRVEEAKEYREGLGFLLKMTSRKAEIEGALTWVQSQISENSHRKASLSGAIRLILTILATAVISAVATRYIGGK